MHVSRILPKPIVAWTVLCLALAACGSEPSPEPRADPGVSLCLAAPQGSESDPSAAGRAGLDYAVRFDGGPALSVSDRARRVGPVSIGSHLSLEVLRGSERIELQTSVLEAGFDAPCLFREPGSDQWLLRSVTDGRFGCTCSEADPLVPAIPPPAPKGCGSGCPDALKIALERPLERSPRRAELMRRPAFQAILPAHEALVEGNADGALAALNRVDLGHYNAYERAVVHQEYGLAYSQLERYDEAAAAFERAVAEGVLSPALEGSLLLGVARLHREAGETEKAISAARRSFAASRQPEALILAAQLHLVRGDLALARTMAEQAVSLTPEVPARWAPTLEAIRAGRAAPPR